jgi:hypothetical protein
MRPNNWLVFGIIVAAAIVITGIAFRPANSDWNEESNAEGNSKRRASGNGYDAQPTAEGDEAAKDAFAG